MREEFFVRTTEIEPLSDEPETDRLFDETEVELIDGIEVPKMSPKRRHSVLQLAIGEMLRAWAGERGTVGTEWRFCLEPQTDCETSLVPDIAFVSAERLESLTDDEVEEPPFAPDIAVEIRSPGDRERNVARKIKRHLEHGGRLVLDIQPALRTIVAHDANGRQTFGQADTFNHVEVSGLTFSVGDYFAKADWTRRKASDS